MTLAAALLVLAALASLAALVGRVRPRPLALTVPIALAALVTWNALALEALSWFSAVNAPAVAAAQAVPILAWLALARRNLAGALRRGVRRLRFGAAALGVAGLAALPLLALAALSATRYGPQNWDSMTYHLARVAHWIQHASVEAYRTHIPRQNALGPGAEYLLLVVQLVARTDSLANSLQLCCYALAIWSVPSLARLAGTPRSAARWLAPAVASIPMGILQASTTQNDLVASVMAIALLAAATPFLHRGRPRFRGRDVVLLAVVGAAAVLVKLTALLAAAPVLVVAAVLAARALLRGGAARRLGGLAVGLAIAAAVVVPYAIRLRADSAVATTYVYPLASEWDDRGANLLRGVAHHLPAPPRAVQALGIPARESLAWPNVVLNLQEDYAGNPLHLALALALLVLALARWRRLTALARSSVLAGAGAWMLFHLVLRDNIWFSRLQTPLFVVVPALLSAALPRRAARDAPAGAASRGRQRAALPPSSRAPAWIVPAAAVLLLAYGLRVAVGNSTRPPLETPPWAGSGEGSYYVLRPDVAPEHALALSVAEQLRCTRIGLYIDPDSFDYPLTWRAMQRGIEVRHVFFDDDARWPCVTVSNRGSPPPVGGAEWLRASRQVFVSPLAVGR